MAHESQHDASFGVVVIGRNEGERLRTCLASCVKYTDNLVYVDSGSTDDSVNTALTMGAVVVDLDLATPFSAARARNEGFHKLCEVSSSQIIYVQFVDGDCEIVDGWLDSAICFLEQNEEVVVVCGRRRERFPANSVYNRLCDMEWDTPVGKAKACGGDAMIKVEAFKQVGGYRIDLIAGEEPELCVRLRQRGWKIWRLDLEMTLHDAAIIRFSQWWKRTTRAGYAFAQGAYLHGKLPDRHCVRETLSVIVWGLFLPLVAFGLLVFSQPWGLLLFGLYPIQVMRVYRKSVGLPMDKWWYSFYLVLGKFPEMIGVLRFVVRGLVGGKNRLIEYK